MVRSTKIKIISFLRWRLCDISKKITWLHCASNFWSWWLLSWCLVLKMVIIVCSSWSDRLRWFIPNIKCGKNTSSIMNHICYMSRAILIVWRLTQKKPTLFFLHSLPYYIEGNVREVDIPLLHIAYLLQWVQYLLFLHFLFYIHFKNCQFEQPR